MEQSFMAFNLATVFGFILISGVLLLVILLFGWLIRPKKKPSEAKAAIYECAEKPFGSAWFNFNNRFYIIALVFVVFDVEVALVVPVAVIFRKLVEQGNGLLAFAEMFFFLTVLFVALIYVWARDDLKWVQALTAKECTEVEMGRKE
jgi:NADH-quinone oxidoreductase subunit A